jgi:serine/threonine protein kinase
LDKRKGEGRTLIWRKLHEAALGLEYLHQNDIVHGDLKCNQILVTGEGVAKLTDFGFSFVLSESKPQGSGGATRWRAPECLGYKGQMPTFESDIYSFGMCVVEAVTYDVPWGVYLPDAAVMDHLRHRQFLARPKEFAIDAEWEFVLALCAFDSSKRIKLVDAIRYLERFAQGITASCSFSLTTPNELHTRRFSKKDSLELLEENYVDQTRASEVKVYNAVQTLTNRRRYLCFRRAVLTIQTVFRYKKQLHQHRALAFRHACAAKIAGFVMMAHQRKKFLHFVSVVRLMQCRFRYRCNLRANAEELREKQDAEENDRQYRTKTETDSTQSSWATSAAGNAAASPPAVASNTQTSRSPASGLQWVNDEDRFYCCICSKDFTMFRRRHHCRVCFEIICNDCSLTRKKMRVCVVCAGLRPRGDPLSSTTQSRRRERFLERAGGFFTGIGSRLTTSRRPVEETMAYSAHESGLDSSDLMLDGQTGLWEDDYITAVRIPRHAVKIEQLISRGAYGEVHLGTWNGMQVAVKTLLPESRKRLLEITEFLAEARMIARMEHPCIVNLVGVAWDALTDVCMVMEYMDGGDLRSLLDEYKEHQHPVGFSTEKLSIAMNVAHALTYLHSLVPPVLHRDLKSRNILLNRALEAKVTDFGVSREYASRTMTAGVGTSLWMAPEIIMGESYDEKADIFSFGIVLVELDTHTVPYATARATLPPVRVMQAVVTGNLRVEFSQAGPQSVVDLGNSCIALDPADRPTAAEAMYRLHSALREMT